MRRMAPSRIGLEALEIGGERSAAVLPRDAVDPARVGVELVAADHQPAGFFPQVDQVVGIAHAGRLVRQLAAGDGLEGDVLVIDGRRRDVGAGHGGHLRAPTGRRH